MTDKIDIINNALIKVGEAPVIDINSDAESASYALDVFQLAVDEVIGEGEWSSVIFREKLFPLVKKDLKELYSEYLGFYQLPTEPRFIRMISVFNYTDDFLVHGNYLMLKIAEPCIIEYLGSPASVGYFNNYLVSSIVDKLAEKLALVLTDKQDLLDRLKSDYLLNLKANLGKDHLQSSKRIVKSRLSSSIIRAGY